MKTRSAIAALCLGALALALAHDGADRAARAEAPGDAAVTKVQFRDLFRGGGKPSNRAVALSGQLVTMEGFLAPAPDGESPFYVAVGAPTTVCPYCSTIDDEEHLPFVLVYPENGETPAQVSRSRMIFVGRLAASHQNEDFYGIHNDIRLLDAQIVEVDYGTRQWRPKQAARLEAARAERTAARQDVDWTEIDD